MQKINKSVRFIQYVYENKRVNACVALKITRMRILSISYRKNAVSASSQNIFENTRDTFHRIHLETLERQGSKWRGNAGRKIMNRDSGLRAKRADRSNPHLSPSLDRATERAEKHIRFCALQGHKLISRGNAPGKRDARFSTLKGSHSSRAGGAILVRYHTDSTLCRVGSVRGALSGGVAPAT